jgi:hypothetical protein
MSLHKFAEQVAANGRGDDSLLVHMTPDEVRNLQKFAQANGTTLTINPVTGLPEAGLLSDLFKAVAPIALGAFLGPGAFGIAGLGMSAGMAGAAVGGLTTLATGSLSRGLMAGLGAYGGAGLAEGLMGAGAGAAQQSAMGALTQDQITAQMAESGLTQQGVLNQAAADATKNALANTGQAVSSGFSAATASPSAMGSFAKDNLKYLAAAASPIMADMMTPTTTKMPEMGNTGYIRQKVYDPYTQTYTSMAPIKASEFGSRQLSDLGRGFNGGGIVALAHGGVPGYANGALVDDKQILDYFATPGAKTDAQIAADMQTYNVTAADIARATGTQGLQGDYEKRFVQAVATPTVTAPTFLAQTADVGLQNQPLATALSNTGLSGASQYALTHGDVGTSGGLAGLSANINAALTDPSLTREAAQTAMTKYNITDADVQRATGQTSGDIFAARDAAAKAAADKIAADAAAKAAADAVAAKAAADKIAADKAAADKAAADKAAADKAAADKAAADKAAADKAAADKAAADKFARDKAAADKAAADKAAADKIAADAAAKIARDKAIADKIIADKIIADKIAADKVIADAAAAKAIADAAAAAKIAAEKAAADAAAKALAEGKTLAEATAAAAKAKAEADAIARAAADKAAADAAAAANKVTSIGVVDLLTNTGVTQDTRDTTTLGTNTLATTTPGAITSSITTDGQYIGTTGTTPAVGTKVGEGTIAGTGTEASTGTTGPIINYGGTSGFSTAPLTLAQTQLTQQAADTTAAQNKQLDLYRSFVTQNPNATDLEHANFMDKINLSPDVAARATPLSGQQMKNRYYDAKYNKMTGDSQSAYNFLMGKGAYPTKSGVGEIMRPYSEATLGMPASTNQKYIFDPTTRSYKLNQDYVGTTRDATGAVNYTMSPAEIASYFKANQGQADSTTYDWAIENGLNPEQIAAATGVPLSTVAAKWRDAKAKKDKAAAEAKAASLFNDPSAADDGGTAAAAAAAAATAADSAAASAASASGTAPGSDGSPGSGARRGGLMKLAMGGMPMYAVGGGLGSLGSYSDGGRLLRGPGDGVSDSIPATIGRKQQPARLADGEFVVPARIVSELGNGSTEAGAKKLYAMMDRVQRARGKTTGKNKVAANSRADKHLPA